MKTMKLDVKQLWEACRGVLLSIVSLALVAVMAICLMVDCGMAQKLAEHSEGIYIVTAVWFAIVAFCSCKQLRGGKPDVKLISTGGKHSAKTGV